MVMATKSQQLQIRVTPRQKATLRRLADAAGQELSSYVLDRLLPPVRDRFNDLVARLGSADRRFVLAELHDFLMSCASVEFGEAVEEPPPAELSCYLRNYVAAMVEQAAVQKGLVPPDWTHEVAPLATPHFVTPLAGLRLHLLKSSPVPFKRRNIFVDSGVGARV